MLTTVLICDLQIAPETAPMRDRLMLPKPAQGSAALTAGGEPCAS